MVGSTGGWHLHPITVWLDGPYHACCPHHLNHDMLKEQPHHCHPTPPPHPCAELARYGSGSCFGGHRRNQPDVLLGTVLVLKQNQPQALAKLSVSYSEGELFHHPPPIMTTWLSLWSAFGCRLWLRLAPSPLLLPTASQAAPAEEILVQSPGASFPVLVQGTMLITALHPAA